MPDSSYSELLDRLAAIEDWRENLKVSDLPLKALQDKLEQDWQPNAQTMLGAKSITPPMLGFDVNDELDMKLVADTGVTTIWAGGAARSSTKTVAHDLGRVPKIVLPMVVNATGFTADPLVITFNYTNTQFQFRVQTVDGQLPAATVTTPTVNWVAIG